MKVNFVAVLIVVAAALIGFNALLFYNLRSKQSPTTTSQANTPPQNVTAMPRPSRSVTPQELPVQVAAKSEWPVFTNEKFGYTIQHPTDFTVESRGQIGVIQDLTAFNYTQGTRITVVKVEVLNQPAKNTSRVTSEKGKDANGNEVIVYSYPYKNGGSIVLTGTIYPNIGGDFKFGDAITQMAQSLKIQ